MSKRKYQSDDTAPVIDLNEFRKADYKARRNLVESYRIRGKVEIHAPQKGGSFKEELFRLNVTLSQVAWAVAEGMNRENIRAAIQQCADDTASLEARAKPKWKVPKPKKRRAG